MNMDREMEEFAPITLTGRMCFLFMCIERYLISCYPDRDWTPVAAKMWQLTERYWDEGDEIYDQVIPAFLLEFDNYRETNKRAYDGKLPVLDYFTFLDLYSGITDGNEDDEINQVLMLPIDFINECEGTDFSFASRPTLKILGKAKSILQKHHIDVPAAELFHEFSIKQNNGWGDFINSTHLSILLN